MGITDGTHQKVNHWLLTTQVWVQLSDRHKGHVVNKAALEHKAKFSLSTSVFPCQLKFHH